MAAYIVENKSCYYVSSLSYLMFLKAAQVEKAMIMREEVRNKFCAFIYTIQCG